MGFLNNDLRHAVVCGHLGCQVIEYWLKKTNTKDSRSPQSRFLATTVEAVNDTYPDLTGREYIDRLICEHALFQLENLQMHQFIRDRLEANTLKLHLWIVNDQTARILSYNPRLSTLMPIEEM